MPFIFTEKLINTALARGAHGFELAAGRPPTLLMHDQKIELNTKSLDEDDMKSFARDLGFSPSLTEAAQTFRYRDTDVMVSKSADRLIFRIKN